MTDASLPKATGRPAVRSIFIAAVIAGIANSVIRIAALAAGAEKSISGMMEGPVLVFTVAGVLLGALGWWIVVRYAKKPRAVLTILVPVVYVLSLIVLVGEGVSVAESATWTAMVGLALMHLVTIAVAVPIYRRFIWGQ